MAIIEANAVISDITDGFLVIGLIPLPDALHLQTQKERFHNGIIPTVPFPTHAALKLIAVESLLEFLASILATAIGVDTQSSRRIELANREL